MLVFAPLAFAALVAPPQESADVRPTATRAQEDVAPHLKGVASARHAALDWLIAFQDADGRWDCDGFAKHAGPVVEEAEKEAKGDESDVFWDDDWLEHDPRRERKAKPVAGWGEGAGDATHDIGVTGLALLALMADGGTNVDRPYSKEIALGLKWLRSVQALDSGLIGGAVGHAYMYDHGIASLALVEALDFDKRPRARESAQHAINYITRARNPYSVWRYEVPPNGDNDTSVTTWMVLAIEAARRADLKVDPESLSAAIQWIDEMTDPSTGRVGYTLAGSVSSRIPGVNVQFGMESTETLTAAGLLCRLTLGQKPAESQALIDSVRLIVRTIPDEVPHTIDDALWVFYGTRSTSRLGGRPWQMWSEIYVPAIVRSQSKDSPGLGSWDPKNAWGFSMGRVGTTALLAWTLASAE